MTSLNPDRGARRRAPGGFTLVEVLIALVILAVGLLALEAMGIGAARSVARAQAQSEFSAVAAHALESKLNDIRAGTAGAGTSTSTVARGATMTVVVARQDVSASSALDLWTVTVTVTPPAGSVLKAADGVTLRSNVIQ